MSEATEQWTEMRARMAEGIEALLCFDYCLTGAELYGATSYILDTVVRPEFERAMGIEDTGSWRVMTIEAHGGRKIIRELPTMEAACSLCHDLNTAGASLDYWYERA